MKLHSQFALIDLLSSPPARGAWIEIHVQLERGLLVLVAPRTGGVD